MKEKMLEGKVAIVSGASYGMGFSMAELFAKEGAKVVMTARGREKLDAAVNELKAKGLEVTGVVADNKNLDDVKNVIRTAVDTYGDLDIVINNAAIGEQKMIDETDDEWLEQVNYSRPIKVKMEQPEDRRTDRDIYIEFLRDQVQYDRIRQEDTYGDKINIVDGIINIIADIATTDPPDGYERVNGRQYPHEVVKSRLLKMDYETITHVLERFKENKTEIRNMRSYLLTALYNARDEKDIQFQNFFNHSYYGTDWTGQRRED